MAGVFAQPLGQARHAALVTAAVLAITGFGLALRLLRLDAASLWADEAFSAYWPHRSLYYLWTAGLFIETTPPLYYMLLKFWTMIAGTGDWALRLFSVIASTATIPLVFLLGLEVATPAAALAAAAIFAISPMQIAYAQEARVYALLPLAFALALLGLLRFLRAARTGDRTDRWPSLALFATGEVVLIYLHATSVFTVAALTLAGGVLLLRDARLRSALPRFALATAAVAVLSGLQLWAIYVQTGRHDLSWIQPPDLIGLLNLFSQHFVDPVTPQRLLRLSCLLALPAGGLLLANLPWLRLDRTRALLLLGVPGLFLGTCIGLSFISPFLIPRMTIWIGVPLSLLAGMALASAAPVWLRGGFALMLAACIAVGLNGTYVRVLAEKEDWRGLMAELLPQLGAQDMVVIGPDTSLLPMLHYAEGSFHDNGRELFRWEPKRRPPDLYQPDHVQTPIAAPTEALVEQARQGRRVWLLLRSTDWRDHAGYALGAPRPPDEIDRRHPMVVLVRW
jgi:4-amino-4-deoxy-L-arabinose transferase-like glycosyltransferase